MRTRGVGWASIVTLLTLLVLTGLATWATHQEVDNQESRLLRERTNEVGLILTSAVTSLTSQMDVLGGVLRATNESRDAFARAGDAIVSTSTDQVGLALLSRTPAGFTVRLAAGTGLRAGQVISDSRSHALQEAFTDGALVPTDVFGTGANRSIGFAVGAPTAPSGTVLYRQDQIGLPGPPREANTAPFNELKVALYTGTAPTAADVLLTTTRDVPLTGRVETKSLPIGATTWTLQVAADHPLVGSAAAIGPWIVLGGGIVVSLLVAAVVTTESRRRRSAIALYDSEHRIAETLQLSLLPQLPRLDSIRTASRYVAGGGPGQQVGGDWFDVFALTGDRIGIVIGDVAGHDLSAAAVMAQIQAALRAYANEGPEPAALLSRLDLHVTNSPIDRLVTVFYGILHPPAPDGRRMLRYANAGHLPPLVRHADGGITDLDDAGSILLGAPVTTTDARPHADVELDPGATLLLFTDGLVEARRQSLTDRLDRLRTVVSAAPADIGPDELCEHLLHEMQSGRLRDDVAVLAVQLTQVAPAADESDVARAET